MPPRQSNKIRSGVRWKYTCPKCGQNAWAKPGAKLICGVCEVTMETKERMRDLTKYRFGGKELGKGRLVVEVVREYARRFPGVTAAGLEKAFPAHLQRATESQPLRRGEDSEAIRVVVARLEDAPQDYPNRFHLKEDDLIPVADATMAVSREWNYENIAAFIEHARDLGFEIEEAD